MANVKDVAEYILGKTGSISAMKLQKLVYYSQAWALVWDDEPLFDSRIEAWANGPVSPILYDAHRGQFKVTTVGGKAGKLSEEQTDTIDKVIEYYNDKTAQYLSDLTHEELPWKDARKDIPDGVRSDQEITKAAMAEYYGSL